MIVLHEMIVKPIEKRQIHRCGSKGDLPATLIGYSVLVLIHRQAGAGQAFAGLEMAALR
jgi:hypothetical protein